MSDLHELARTAVKDFSDSIVAVGARCDPNLITIEILPKPHKPSGLPKDRMAIYCFFLGDQPLKVGIAGPNSDPRYRSQHYNPNSAGSTLAGSILSYPSKVGLSYIKPEIVGDWIKSNTDRVNILLPSSFGKWMLLPLEKFLHRRWNPVYEGRVAVD